MKKPLLTAVVWVGAFWVASSGCGSASPASSPVVAPVVAVAPAPPETEQTERARAEALQSAGAYFVVNANLAALRAMSGIPELLDDFRSVEALTPCAGAIRTLDRATFANTLLMEGFNDQLLIVATGPVGAPPPGAFDFERCAKLFDADVSVVEETRASERLYRGSFERFPMEGECTTNAQCPRFRENLEAIPRGALDSNVLLEVEVASVLLHGLLEITGGAGVPNPSNYIAFRSIVASPRLRVRVRSDELEMVLFLSLEHDNEPEGTPTQAAEALQQMLRIIASDFGRTLEENIQYASRTTVTILRALQPVLPLIADVVVSVEDRKLVAHVPLTSAQLAAVISGARTGLRAGAAR